MATIDLLVLGILIEQPRSAYDLQKQIEYRNLDRWVKISSPSIYKKVLQLEEKGYLTNQVLREGKMPEKTIYSITLAGKEHFEKLMAKTANENIRVLLDFNAVIVNLNKLPKNQSLELIEDIRSGLEKNIEYIHRISSQREDIPLVGKTIIEQQTELFVVMKNWINKFEKEFAEET